MAFQSAGQQSIVYENAYTKYKEAIDLFDKEKYGAAQKLFLEIHNELSGERSEIAVNAQYYEALCGLQLFNADAESLLLQFVYEHPENPNSLKAYFDLGKYEFRKKRFRKVIQWFEKIDLYNLSNEELAEYYFKLGYSYFMREELELAKKSLFEIRDTETKYTSTAQYYYAHIAYLQKNYETSLTYFRKIEQPAAIYFKSIYRHRQAGNFFACYS